MSFAEFTYPLLQAWDWWHMYKEADVQLQIGGSDQYGNIIAGMDAIKHIAQNSADCSDSLDASGKLLPEVAPMGLTVPLLTTASGEKFGKSAGNAVWLDKKLTSPFDLYGVSCLPPLPPSLLPSPPTNNNPSSSSAPQTKKHPATSASSLSSHYPQSPQQ
jgi:tyrosyl-tRNA synthetase